MKTWISFLLPEDEYKEKKILHFFAEGAFVLLVFLVGSLLLSRFMPIAAEFLEIYLLLAIFVFCGYVFIRYIFSGIEYAEVASEGTYHMQVKRIRKNSLRFFAVFVVLVLLFKGLPGNFMEIVEAVAVPSIAAILMFLANSFSLRNSYRKNRELI